MVTAPASPTLAQLFMACAKVGLLSFGGGLVGWLNREFVSHRLWINDDDFNSLFIMAQMLPGSNIVNLVICLGDQLRGAAGATACVAGFLVGPFFAVIGLVLTNFASNVTLVHRRDALRAEKILQNRVFAHEKIEVIWNSGIEEVVGSADGPAVATAVRLRNTRTGATRDLKADGVFVAIGHSPSTDLLAGQLRLKQSGNVWTEPGSTRTSIEGVFAAGDLTDETFRQAVTAAGQGCMAALALPASAG
jgi:hypothetical protein